MINKLIRINDDKVLDLVIIWKNKHAWSNKNIHQWKKNFEAHINEKNNKGETALLIALDNNQYSIVNFLLRMYSNIFVNSKNKDRYTELILSLEKKKKK